MKTIWCSIIVIAATALVVTTASAQPQTWDKQINNHGRFKVLGQFGEAAVLDQETGLVWKSHRLNLKLLGPLAIRTPRTSCAMSKLWEIV